MSKLSVSPAVLASLSLEQRDFLVQYELARQCDRARTTLMRLAREAERNGCKNDAAALRRCAKAAGEVVGEFMGDGRRGARATAAIARNPEAVEHLATLNAGAERAEAVLQ